MKLDKHRLEHQPDFEFWFRGLTVYMFFDTMTEFIEDLSPQEIRDRSQWRSIDFHLWCSHLAGVYAYPDTYAAMLKAHLDWCNDRLAEDIILGVEPTP